MKQKQKLMGIKQEVKMVKMRVTIVTVISHLISCGVPGSPRKARIWMGVEKHSLPGKNDFPSWVGTITVTLSDYMYEFSYDTLFIFYWVIFSVHEDV